MTHALRRTGPDLMMVSETSAEAEKVADDVLVARAAGGDEAAFAILVDRHLSRVLAVARRMLGDEAEAEDVAQETLLKLWHHAADYDSSRAKLSTWLYRVATNLSIDRLRKRSHSPLDEAPEPELDAVQEAQILEGQLSERVDRAIQSLPERQRLALVLFHYQELSMRETADILDCSEEAVESLLARGRRALKGQLKAEWHYYMPGSR